MEALETYLRHMYRVRSSGEAVAETSYYGALEQLLNETGATLKPKIHCIVNIKNRGAGIPDLGLFLERPLTPSRKPEPWSERVPERGVVEAKGPHPDVKRIAARKQVATYLNRYGKVLVTNYREFLLVVQDQDGGPRFHEQYRLADSESAFWAAASKPAATVSEHLEPFQQFLQRVLQHDAPIVSPQDLAWFLAGYARTALKRIEDKQLDTLQTVRQALEEALGLEFQGSRGERFFHSALIQTLFYGVFSAWVLWSAQHDPESNERFEWRQAAWSLNVPMVRVLFEQIATPSNLAPLQLDELMDWSEEALNRVNRPLFFQRFEETRAVQYFYEPFLEAFDPDLRRQLGVWYTPPEVVRYMVARVDQTLRTDFELANGLADPRVVVLDPCTGTGSYLVEVLRTIAANLKETKGDALVGLDVKAAAQERVFGFELLPAPFVVAHLQLGLLLAGLGAPLDQRKGERAAVYLTNSLTGWDEHPHQQRIVFPELEEERDAAEAVKQDAPILVILGNPPYNGFAGVSPQEEGDLLATYKAGLREDWGVIRDHLDDLYVRFFRVAERRIVDVTGEGIVCLISNFSYLADPTAVVMRQHFLSEFDAISIDNLNGDSRETGKVTPDGKPDPSIFSTQYSRAGIQVGTAITLLARTRDHDESAVVRYRDFWGPEKSVALLDAAHDDVSAYALLEPTEDNRFGFRPTVASGDYYSWAPVTDLWKRDPSLGLNENRGGALIDTDRAALVNRMTGYLDPAVAFQELSTEFEDLKTSWARFDPESTRTRLLRNGGFVDENVRPFIAKPLDVHWAYVDTTRKLWNEPRPDLVRWADIQDQRFLVVRRRAPRANDGAAFLIGRTLGDQHCVHKDGYFVPLYLSSDGHLGTDNLFGEGDPKRTANLSDFARMYLSEVGIGEDEPDFDEVIWLHVLAIGYSPMYLRENEGGIRADWPRIPLPVDAATLRTSAQLGRKIAGLVDPIAETVGGMAESLPPAARAVGRVRGVEGRVLDTSAGDLRVTAGWGIRGRNEIVMPGAGRLSRRSLTESGLPIASQDDASLLGGEVLDIFLNDGAYWESVPAAVWTFKIGGYQVAKKWLSYREYGILGRSLTNNEVREFTTMTQRLTALVLLSTDLDESYEAVKGRANSKGR
jgi:hypothetical protein